MSGAPPSLRILLVEDNEDLAANTREYLQSRGHVVDCASTSRRALDLASARRHDAVVLDIGLPGLDGTEVCRRLKAMPGRSPAVLMLTARDTAQDKLTSFEAGAGDYLVKPFSLAVLQERLFALVRRGPDRLGDPARDTIPCGIPH